jgi:EAL domain-containing protein (putative c-di-GMP-specific phosphodiesterase class I)
MAHSLGLTVVAEGVDEAEHIQLLQELGCDEAQGFLYTGAVPIEEIGPLLRSWSERAKPERD